MPKTPLSSIARLGLVATALAAVLGTPAAAAQIDLLLDIEYASQSIFSGGNWSLLAKTDGEGLFSLTAPLTGINSVVNPELPVGRVNGSATPNAGFASFASPGVSGQETLIVAAQQGAQSGQEQGYFYGVGTLTNGSPRYPGQLGGTNSTGPNIPSLTGVQNVPWGTEPAPFLGGVTVASGSFSAGVTPDFGTRLDRFDGRVFTTVGTIVDPGEWTDLIDFTTAVRTNLEFGVATGDYNADGLVDAADYTVWRDALGNSVTPSTSPDGDGDGQITELDRLVWADNYGLTSVSASGPGVASQAIPEPSTMALALLAALRSAGRRMSRGRAGKTAQSCSVA